MKRRARPIIHGNRFRKSFLIEVGKRKSPKLFGFSSSRISQICSLAVVEPDTESAIWTDKVVWKYSHQAPSSGSRMKPIGMLP